MLECGLHYLNVVLHYQNTYLHFSEESPTIHKNKNNNNNNNQDVYRTAKSTISRLKTTF
jgi:hypothetical protein